MKKILILLVMIIGTSLQAQQAFDFECAPDPYGDLSSFFPSVFDVDGDEVAYSGTITIHGAIKINSQFNPGFTAYVNTEGSEGIPYGNSVIFEYSRNYSPFNYYSASSHSKFNDLRVVGGEYEGYVLIKNVANSSGYKGQVFAEWETTGTIKILFVVHNYDNANTGWGFGASLYGPINFTKPN